MNIHEYQAKGCSPKFGVAVLSVRSPTPPTRRSRRPRSWAQIWVVKRRSTPAAGKAAASRSRSRWTRCATMPRHDRHDPRHPPTAPGQAGEAHLCGERCDIRRELYLGMLVDRATSRITIMASTEGGVRSRRSPPSIRKRSSSAIDPATAFAVHAPQSLRPRPRGQPGFVLRQVRDCDVQGVRRARFSIVEINPLVVTGAGDVIALDAKMNFATTRSTATRTWRRCATRTRKTRGAGSRQAQPQLHQARRTSAAW